MIDLFGQIQSPQRHPEQEPQPSHDAVARADAHACVGQVQLEAADILKGRCVRGSLQKRREPLAARWWQIDLRMWPRCVPAQSLRAFISSIIR